MIKVINLNIKKNTSYPINVNSYINSLSDDSPIVCVFPEIDYDINYVTDNISSRLNRHFTLINNKSGETLGLLWHIKLNRYLFLAINNYDNQIHFKKNLNGVSIEVFLKNAINFYLTNKTPTTLKNSLNKNTTTTDLNYVYNAQRSVLEIKIKKDHREMLAILQKIAESKKTLNEINKIASKTIDVLSLETDDKTKESIQVSGNTVLWHTPMKNTIVMEGDKKTEGLDEIKLPEMIPKIHLDRFNKSTYDLFTATSHNQYIDRQINPHLISKSKNSNVYNAPCLGSFDDSFREAKLDVNISYMVDLVNLYLISYNGDDHTPVKIMDFKDEFEPVVDYPIKDKKISKPPVNDKTIDLNFCIDDIAF